MTLFPVVTLLVALAVLTGACPAFAQLTNPYPCTIEATEFVDPAFTALPGTQGFSGRFEGGLYQIEVPNNWNGEFVAYQHGAVAGPSVRVQVPALRAHWIANGFAWGAASFRCNSPLAGIGVIDTDLLVTRFAQLTGKQPPVRTWAVGQSNGGGGVLTAMEFSPTRYAGGLAMCPVDARVGDFRLSVAKAAEAISGLPLSEPMTPERIGEVFGTPTNYTAKGRQLASVQIHLSGGPRPFAVEGLEARFNANINGGVLNPAVANTALLRGATNADVRYRIDPGLGLSAERLNQIVKRQSADLEVRTRSPYPEVAARTLKIQRPLITIHGTGDLQVPIHLERNFKRDADRAGTARLLVQRIMRIPGHCQFSDQEQIQAFNDLVKWVKEGKKPEGDDVMADFRDAGRKFTNPLRPGDPGAVSVAPSSANR